MAVSARKVRAVVDTQANILLDAVKDLRVAVNNEQVTRARVDVLEAFFAMRWHARWWWVLTGRCPYFRVLPMPDAPVSAEPAPEPEAA